MKYGTLSARGRRMTDEDEHIEKRAEWTQSQLSKRARNFDPESTRQRQRGMATAAAALGGGALLVRGGRGIRATTSAVRRGHPFPADTPGPWGYMGPGKKPGKQQFVEVPMDRFRHVENTRSRTLSGTPRDLAQVAGGAALLTGAGSAERRANRAKQRKWD